MNLAILCGSLEQGKDGVGDYTQSLAEKLESLGHDVLLCGLNDQWMEVAFREENPRRLRFSRKSGWSFRIKHLTEALDRFQPDFVSLQFVPFAFDNRGLCFQFASRLRSMKSGGRWHVMFHELWLGLEASQPLKYKALGFLQRRICLDLIATLQPPLIHTHAAAYLEILHREKIPAQTLPIFSNIRISPDPDFAGLYRNLEAGGSTLSPSNRREKFVALFFGSLHPEWDPEVLMQKLGAINPVFLAVGRLGELGLEIWRRFSGTYRGRAEFIHLGELAPNEISTAMQFSDAGIAASPWNLLEKSGSVAAMIEHGLPVIVPRNDFLPEENFQPGPAWCSQLHPLWKESFHWQKLVKISPVDNLANVARQFSSDLLNCLRAG